MGSIKYSIIKIALLNFKKEKPRLIEEPPDGSYEDARDFTEKIPRNHEDSNLIEFGVKEGIIPTCPMGSPAEDVFVDKYASVSTCCNLPLPEKMIRNSIFWQYRSFPHFQ